MMGVKTRHFTPVEHMTFDALVPADHFYRHLERTLDLSFVRDLVRDCYAAGGRPSIDPVVFFKLQLVMFFEGIRSERQVLQVAADRLSIRWYLGYDLGESLPDHSSLTRIRDRYGIDVFRRFFDVIVAQCHQARLVWGRELYIDATQVHANASLDSVMPRFAVEAHLADLFAPPDADPPASVDSDIGCQLPLCLAEEVAIDLSDTNAARHDWLAAVGQQQREVVHGRYERLSNWKASRIDPDATLLPAGGVRSHLVYHDHVVVDGGWARIILSVLVKPADVMENQPALDLVWHTCFRWHLRPRQVTGDATYGTAEIIRALEATDIRAYVALRDYDKRSPSFGKREFTYDAERDVYVCPKGALLHLVAIREAERSLRYQANAAICEACASKAECTTSKQGRVVTRSFDEAYVERVRGYMRTTAYGKTLRKRSVWVEPLFGEAKQWHGLERLRLRGLSKVNGEALLITPDGRLGRSVGTSPSFNTLE